MTGSFLEEPPVSPQVQALYDDDLADGGYVWNVSRLWAHQPDTVNGLFELMSQAFKASGLSFRQRGILVTAAASALGDSYCSLAWGRKRRQAPDPAAPRRYPEAPRLRPRRRPDLRHHRFRCPSPGVLDDQR